MLSQMGTCCKCCFLGEEEDKGKSTGGANLVKAVVLATIELCLPEGI